MRKYWLVILCLGFCVGLTGQSTSTVCGVWKGVLDLPGTQLELYFDIGGLDDELSATMTVPAQAVYDLPVDCIQLEGLRLSLEIAGLDMSYSGMLVKNFFLGEFSQHGMKFPMSLVRSELPQRLRPQEPVRPFPYREQEVTFRNEQAGIALAGTWTVPEGVSEYDAVILVTGSGAQNRDEALMGHKPFLVLADALTRAGYAVLRYDDRGVGDSEGLFSGATTEDFSYDAQAALSYVRSLPGVRRVGVLGHSEGASIAFLVAARDASCDFVISFAGPGIRGDEVLMSQSRAIYRLSGYPEAQIDQALVLNRAVFDRILSSTSNDAALRREVEALVGDPQAVNQLLDPWMYAFIRFSPQEALRRISVPVLAFNGTKDVQVLMDLNLGAIGAALAEGGNQQVRLEALEDLNHLGQHCQSGLPQEYAQIEETIAPEIIHLILEFLQSTLR